MQILVYLQYFNQILTIVLEVLDDSESSIRELALSLIFEMLRNQVCLISSFPFLSNMFLLVLVCFIELLTPHPATTPLPAVTNQQNIKNPFLITLCKFLFLSFMISSHAVCVLFPEGCHGGLCRDYN